MNQTEAAEVLGCSLATVSRLRSGERTPGIELMKEIRQTEFDYVFDMQGLLRTGLMTSRTRAKHKVGRTDAREMSGIWS